MKILSVNVSLAQQVTHQDKIISTGIFKKPVEQTTKIHHFGLAGDTQVDLKNHGGEHKAVYAFSAAHYPYWQQSLNVEHLPYGSFGENLTFDSLDEDTICIGDLIQVGTATLQVTQPRVPCFKLGIALNKEDMPRLFVEKAETGIYFRVIEEGVVQAGDEAIIIQRDASVVPVKTLFQAYFDKSIDEAQRTLILKTAAEIPALSKEWLDKVQSRLV